MRTAPNARRENDMNNLAIAQQRWDDMEPDDEPAFLETNEGSNWLSGAVDRLVIQGKDLHINDRCSVWFGDYTKALGKAVTSIEIDADSLGFLIASVVSGDLEDAREAAQELTYKLGHKTPKALCESIASTLCEAIAEKAADQIRKDNEE